MGILKRKQQKQVFDVTDESKDTLKIMKNYVAKSELLLDQ